MILVVTTNRADYGLVRPLLFRLKKSKVKYGVLASGNHFSLEQGKTIQAVKEDRWSHLHTIAMSQRMLSSGDIAAQMSFVIVAASRVLQRLRPKIVVVSGDRFEMVAVALAAFALRIPIAHVHAGETSFGAMDEAFRHSLTHMASLAFCATKGSLDRVEQLRPELTRVVRVGSTAMEPVLQLSSRSMKQAAWQLKAGWMDQPYCIYTYHPETLLSERQNLSQLRGSLLALAKNYSGKVLVTSSNNDPGGFRINQFKKKFCTKNSSQFLWVPHLGNEQYFQTLANCQVVIGNSSSGILEAGFFAKPVLNLGNRQKGREAGGNVVTLPVTDAAIVKALRRVLSKNFISTALRRDPHPYLPPKAVSGRRVMASELMLRQILAFLRKP